MFSKCLPIALALVATANAALTYTGHDLSSLKLMEDGQGANFYTEDGTSSSAEDILGDGGMNAVRLRLWTGSGLYDLDYTLTLAERFYTAGYDIYLDLHLSDTWADPDSQEIPSAWPSDDIDDLASTLQDYVSSTLESFSDAGVDVSILSIGNEISSGFLFPLGEISDDDFSGFATLFAAARAGVDDAVSAGVSKPDVMIHLNNGYDESLQTWFYEGLVGTGTVSTDDWDVFGVSFYPFYGTDATLDNLQTTLTTLSSTYGKPMYVAETDWPEECSGVTLSESSIAVSAEGQTTWVDDIIEVLEAVDNGAGIFYWEPAFINNTALGSSCDDAILFDVDWSDWPETTVTARSSVDMYASSGASSC
ncbi:MAG: hypothetical protein M1834_004906 [Cirrosporium novae-zelandiae]|nr:MAG: hypothetical protein M1834_004906 [Cirrosporium novae-zelandiae]